MKENFEIGMIPDGHIDELYDEIDSIKSLCYFIKRDFEKINGRLSVRKFLVSYFFEPGFKYCFWLRVTRYLHLSHNPLFIVSRTVLKHYSYKFSFDISYRIPIGPGLSIAHIGSIVIAAEKMGSNVFLRPGVVIGRNLLNDVKKTAIVGDNVHFGVGAKIIGNVRIGNNVIVASNAVVTKNVSSNTVVGGIPAKPIKHLNELVIHPVE